MTRKSIQKLGVLKAVCAVCVASCCVLALTAISAGAAPALIQTVPASEPQYLTSASDGAAWFGSTDLDGSRLIINRIGAIGNLNSKSIALKASLFGFAGIARGANGRVWVAFRSKKTSGSDRLYTVTSGLELRRVSVDHKIRIRNLASAAKGAVWARSGSRLIRVTPTGKIRRVNLPKSPSIVQIVSTRDGAVWGIGQRGVVRVTSKGTATKRNIVSGSPIIASAGNGAWIGGETELVHLDQDLGVKRVPLAQRFDEDGISPRLVIGMAGSTDGSVSFVAASGFVAKDVVHAGKPSFGTATLGSAIESRLGSEYDLDVSDSWETSVAIGSPILTIGPASSFVVADFGPGVRVFTSD